MRQNRKGRHMRPGNRHTEHIHIQMRGGRHVLFMCRARQLV